MLQIRIAAEPRTLAIVILFLIPFWVNGQVNNCAPATSYTTLDINNVSAGLLNGGDMWWDLSQAAYEVPKGGGVNAIFSGALWIGGIDAGGALKLAAQTYRQDGNDYFPGPINSAFNVPDSVCDGFDHHWKISRSEINQFLSVAGAFPAPLSPGQIPVSVLHWPAKGNPMARGKGNIAITVEDDLAPFIDADGDGLYNPIWGDYPCVPGDQAVFWVFNDRGNLHTETGADLLGIEVHALAYAYQTTDFMNDATFYQYKIINKSTSTFSDTYIGLFTDVDLGCSNDDYVGCDSTMGIGYSYNGTPIDSGCLTAGYGADPPIIGVKILGGPYAIPLDGTDNDGDGLTDEGNDNLDNDNDGQIDEPDEAERRGMDKFIAYYNDFGVQGNPTEATHYYNYLKGNFKDGSQLTVGGDGHGHLGTTPANYIYPSSPSDTSANSWSECQVPNIPGTRRMVQSSGPVSMKPGQVHTLDFAVLYARPTGVYPCPDVHGIMAPIVAQAEQLFKTDAEPSFCGFQLGTSISERNVDLLKIHPNPAKDEVLISGLNGITVERFDLLDNQGRLVKQLVPEQSENVSIGISDLSAGIYHLIGITNNGSLQGKIVKLE